MVTQHSLQAAETDTLASKTEALKAKVIELNRDLFLLEEDLLHPASTRIALYVSMDSGQLFQLESVKIKLDGEAITSFLYTQRDLEALQRGAIQPLYMDNIASGEHELVALFTGMGPNNRPYKRAVSLKFNKDTTEKAFEIKILDDSSSQQPEFKVKAWQ
ncbi:MAG: AraC family transcriptional regulator [Enterobacterales bacterium]|nr:AraC family transcriptional regulator [Enterobacterales bacterium]